METPNLPAIRALRPAWNKGRIVGQKRPLKPKHVWAIRVRLELAENHRDLALFNMAIDSKLRGCDLVKMKVVDVMATGQIWATRRWTVRSDTSVSNSRMPWPSLKPLKSSAVGSPTRAAQRRHPVHPSDAAAADRVPAVRCASEIWALVNSR